MDEPLAKNPQNKQKINKRNWIEKKKKNSHKCDILFMQHKGI